MRFRLLGFIALVLLSSILGATIALYRLPSASIIQSPALTIPTALATCLPSLEAAQLKARAESGETTYFVVGGYHHQTYWQILLAYHQGQCYSPQPNVTNLPANFLSAFVSSALAQQLWLQIYYQNIQHLGNSEIFQQQFDATIDRLKPTQIAYLSPEQAWALQHLDIEMPSRIRVITPQDYLKLLEQRSLEGK